MGGLRGALAILALASGCSHAVTGPEKDFAVPLDLGVAPDFSTVEADAGTPVTDWSRQVLYLVLVDRFANGSTANDQLGLANCLDVADPQKYHGGDFVGLTQRLGYLEELGVSALWITP